MQHASFFSGIGGFDLAFDNAGFETVFQSEIDRFCSAVLKQHWPNSPLLGNISLIDPQAIPAADVWTAGFPCQDVSLARGNHLRPGFEGKNSSLFFEFFKLVRLRLPKVVILENVLGLLSSNQGNDFAAILSKFSNAGYGVAWRVLNTRYFGAPQSRQRVFVCAVLGEPKTAADILFDDVSKEREDPRAAFREVHRCDLTGAYVPRISFCVAATSGRHTGNDWSRTYIAYENSARRPTPEETERLQGFPRNWTVPISSSRPDVRSYDSDRYKALGNAVSVPVAQWLAKRVWSRVGKRAKAQASYDVSESDLHNRALGSQIRVRRLALEAGGKWSTAGITRGKKALEFSAPDSPTRTDKSRFVDLLSREEDLSQYFISANAAQGMLRRADGLNRRFFEPLDRALRNLAQT